MNNSFLQYFCLTKLAEWNENVQLFEITVCSILTQQLVGGVIKPCLIARTAGIRKYWCFLDTGRKLNVHKTSRKSSEHLSTFSLRPVSRCWKVCNHSLSLLSVKFAQNYRILQNRFFVNFLNSLLKVKGHSLIVLIGNNSQLNVPILQEIKATLLMISKFQVELLSVISYFNTDFLCQFVILLYIS